ncbi:Hypothetical predicted protein, partial [Pelobates cultripes]
EIGGKHLNFLDITLSLQEDGRISTTLYCKATATNSLLNWDSYHPYPSKAGIPIGQYLRLRRNCSTLEDFKIKAANLRKSFKDKGYPNRVLKKAYSRALNSDRVNLLEDKILPSSHQIRCIVTHDAGWHTMLQILGRYWPILTSDVHIKSVISPFPSVT